MQATSAFELNDIRGMRVQGTVLALALRPQKGGAMVLTDSISITPEDGVIGDHGSSSRRQVTLLDDRAWEMACSDLGVTLDWTIRRSNILVSELDLQQLASHQIRIGNTLIEVIGEVVPCHVMDAAHHGLKEALETDWRGGVYGRILSSGQIKVGDTITIYSSQ